MPLNEDVADDATAAAADATVNNYIKFLDMCKSTLTKAWKLQGVLDTDSTNFTFGDTPNKLEQIAKSLEYKYSKQLEGVDMDKVVGYVKLFILKMEGSKKQLFNTANTDYSGSNYFILHDAVDRLGNVNVGIDSEYCVARSIFLEILHQLKTNDLCRSFKLKDSSIPLMPSSFLQRSRKCTNSPNLKPDFLQFKGGGSKSRHTRRRKHSRKSHHKHARKTHHKRKHHSRAARKHKKYSRRR